MTTNQTIDGVPRRVCHACVSLPRKAYCPVCDDQPVAQSKVEPVTMDGKTTIREYVSNSVPEDQIGDDWTKGYEECKRRIHQMFQQPFNAGQPAPVAVDVLSTGFYTTETGGGKYAINIAYRSMAEMQAADQQLRDLLRSRHTKPFAWYTEDYLTDKSATTYDLATMERWKAKGWPVKPLYIEQPAPVAVDAVIHGSKLDEYDAVLDAIDPESVCPYLSNGEVAELVAAVRTLQVRQITQPAPVAVRMCNCNQGRMPCNGKCAPTI